MFKVGENDISNAIQTAAFQTLSKYYLFCNLFLYEFDFVLSKTAIIKAGKYLML